MRYVSIFIYATVGSASIMAYFTPPVGAHVILLLGAAFLWLAYERGARK